MYLIRASRYMKQKLVGWQEDINKLREIHILQ